MRNRPGGESRFFEAEICLEIRLGAACLAWLPCWRPPPWRRRPDRTGSLRAVVTAANDVAQVAERLVARVVEITVVPVWHFVRDKLVTVVERRNEIRSAGVVALEGLGIAGLERKDYRPAPWFTLRRAVPVASVGPEDVFIDFGSGMGRVVYQAAAYYPFKRVIGVELSAQLREIAQNNIQRNRARLRCKDIQLVNSDVLDYKIPDDVTVAFFFNPFSGQTFSTVIQHLLESVARNPRIVRIVYSNPAEDSQLIATGQVRLVKRVRSPRLSREWTRRASTHVCELYPQ
jgi:precorrin-6B methylase 2